MYRKAVSLSLSLSPSCYFSTSPPLSFTISLSNSFYISLSFSLSLPPSLSTSLSLYLCVGHPSQNCIEMSIKTAPSGVASAQLHDSLAHRRKGTEQHFKIHAHTSVCVCVCMSASERARSHPPPFLQTPDTLQ